MPDPAIYLDHAATTPVLPEVRHAMLPYLGAEAFGNPSSAHGLGRAARAALEEARHQVAAATGSDAAHVVFTSGGTEADNLAVLGGALAARSANRPFRVAVGATEHKAVLGAAHAVEALGGEVMELPVDTGGAIRPDVLEAALETGVAIVSVMWVNNETGIIQDVRAVAERCAERGVLFHTDAVQALGKIAVNARDLAGALLSVSAHKIGGPKGVGALIAPDHTVLAPLLHGGGQQGGVRPGTENVAGIVGFGRAAELATEHLAETAEARRLLRDALEARLRSALADLTVHGAAGPRAPHISNVAIPGTDSEAMLMHLDLAGIYCSSGSACTTGSVEPSHVLRAMSVPHDWATASLRFSCGYGNTAADVARVGQALPPIVEKVRRLAAVLQR